jgi:predicted GNAT family N-acyltransferase
MTIDVREADFTAAADNALIRRIRFTVFVDEQRVPAEIEMDDRDDRCVHVLAFDGAVPVGTARIDLDSAGKIGRLAVLESRRRRGVGTVLMTRCEEIAARHGLSSVWCNAQVGAVPFYQSLGYAVTGASFYEANIEHRRMAKSLR